MSESTLNALKPLQREDTVLFATEMISILMSDRFGEDGIDA
jgi:hypothetical protein